MRIMILSNAPWAPTGYGIQVREIAKRMQKEGHQVAVTANFGLSGASLKWQDLPVYPMRQQRQCADVIGYYCQHFNADVCISLYDVWALPENMRERIGVPWAVMVPVDGLPINRETIQRVATAEYVIAYSQFARDALTRAGFDVFYCPHGIDTQIFKPGDKTKARQELGFPNDRFVIATVAANKGYPPRKSWPEMMTAYKIFQQDHPDALWYCHTTKSPYGSGAEGIYFDDLRDAIGVPHGSMAFPDQGALAIGVPDEQIAMIYQASDVMMLPSMGEGFCLPLMEAQACGCPVIAQDCSAMSELTVNGVMLPPMQRMWLPQIRYWWWIASANDIDQALRMLYTRTDGEEENARGVNFAHENYDYDVVWERHWKPTLAQIEATLW